MRLANGLWFLLLLGSGQTAQAAEPEAGELPPAQADGNAREQARQHYSHGLELASQSRYEQALEEFSAAYRASPHFAVLYNLGQTYIALGRPLEAIAALEGYLREGGADVPPERVAQALAQIAEQKAETAELRIAVDSTGASISIDGTVVGTAPLAEPVRVTAGTHTVAASIEGKPGVNRLVTVAKGEMLDFALEVPHGNSTAEKEVGTLAVVCRDPVQIWLDGTPAGRVMMNPRLALAPGTHRLKLVAAGRESAEQMVEIGPGSTATVACLEVTPEPGTDAAVHSQTALSKAHESRVVSTWGYITGGVGVALGAVTVGHYIWNRGRFQDWQTTNDELQADSTVPDYVERQQANNELATSIEHASGVTVGLGVASGVLVATGVTLVVIGKQNQLELTPEVDTAGGSVSLRGVW